MRHRVTFWAALAMAMTAAIGALFGILEPRGFASSSRRGLLENPTNEFSPEKLHVHRLAGG